MVHTARVESHRRALGKKEVQHCTENDEKDAVFIRELESISLNLLTSCRALVSMLF